MENYNQQILNATEQAESIELQSTLDKTIELINSYPLLTQYIKLSIIINEWFDEMILNSEKNFLVNFNWKLDRDQFITNMMTNLEAYSQIGDDSGLKPNVEHMKETLGKLFAK